MGKIFNIQHFSVHDGPGIRTVVFLKGCPMRCAWCANPESQGLKEELAWSRSLCIGCGSCLQQEEPGSFAFVDGSLHWKTKERADWQGLRVLCPTKALHVIGEEKSVEEILDQVERDAAFYDNSGGGMTLSGGEPLAQAEFAGELLREAHRRGIHCAMETTGYASWEDFSAVLSELDYLLLDVKCLDDKVHQKYTGVSNERILDNLRRARETYPRLPIHVRTPVIPGVNDDEASIGAIAEYLSQFSGLRYELLRYHRLGEPKYESLHRVCPMGKKELSADRFEELRRYEFLQQA